MSFLERIKTSFSLDYRSMALYRVLLGLIVMADVGYRFPDLTNFYTDLGLVPRSTFLAEMAMPWSFSLHLANGSLGFIAVMFTINFIFGLMIFMGYHSRWAVLGAFIMNVSVHNRNWLVNNGGDDVLRAILFFSIFLPLNRHFSMDSAVGRVVRPQKSTHFSSWCFAFFLQAFVIYFVSYLLKNSPIWREQFTAMHFVSRLEIFSTPLGHWLSQFPLYGKLVTIFTIYLEWLGPLLLVFSFAFGKRWWLVRLAVVFLFYGLHLGILFSMWIGLFPFICIAMWTIFLPTPLWDFILGNYRKRGLGKLDIFYDGDCNFCKKGVLVLREFLLLPETNVAEAQSDPSILSDMQKHNSWVVVNPEGKRFYHFNALVEVMRLSPVLMGMEKLFRSEKLLSLMNKLYSWVANNRQLMSKWSQFFVLVTPRKEIRWFRWVSEAAGAFMFVTLLMWNLTTIKRWGIKAPFFQKVIRHVHIYQEWNMFAPYPKMDNIWVEIPGTLSNGQQIELITGSTDIYSIKDQLFYGKIPNEHWRKFYLNVSERSNYARYYGGFLCRLWNERNIRSVPETTLRKLEIIVFSQVNLANGGKGGINRKLSWKHWCFDEDFSKDNPGKPLQK